MQGIYIYYVLKYIERDTMYFDMIMIFGENSNENGIWHYNVYWILHLLQF